MISEKTRYAMLNTIESSRKRYKIWCDELGRDDTPEAREDFLFYMTGVFAMKVFRGAPTDEAT